ncbi:MULTISPECIES: ABC transporter substrate-binding protein [unclassified Streptomyces]|uniref:ABC transporter substrate-binding protein n=1 Tax=unclassified Streptomyces TaxID=2593676 RepID=UPI002E2F0530|nr:ABC transporter substrate-binding protein [Streptomyces sp. NBC_01261]WSX55620.1 ABC transporter substrate-binding protein [Streptomyces sp. NBC_00986]
MRRTTRPTFVALTMATTMTTLAALSACTSTDSGSGGAGGKKGTLTLGMSADIQGWDPSNQPGYQGWTGEAVYQSLIQCDAQGKPHPDAAENWTFKKDNTGVTFHLRSGMKFSDGTPVDSAAVKASIGYIGKHGGQAARFAAMKVATPDARTVAITLPKPNPTLILRMCEAKLASPKYLASGQVNKAPVGSGPYTLDKSATTSGSVYSFVKNDSYWNAKAYPYKKLVIKKITSETAALNALKTGQIDGSLITQATYNEAKASGLKILTLHGTTTRLLVTDHQGKKIPALGNLDVRRAMNMVFDKEAMAKDLYRGLATPAAQIFRPGSAAYIKNLKDPYAYNIQKAKDLMAGAGYAKGFTIEIPFMQGQNLETLIPVVKQQLGLLNIKVKQVTLSGPNAISELLSGKYPMPLWQLGNYGESLQDIADYVLPDGIWNVEHQSDPTVTKLYAKVLTSSGQESADAQQDINRYITDQAWFVPMVYPDGFYAYSSKVSVPTMSDLNALNPLLRDFK